MSALKDSVINETLEEVRVVYMDRLTQVWWNSKRKDGDVAVFCGWYWIKGHTEAGPFRTRSSTLRDAYYQYVLKREAPSISDAVLRPARLKAMKTKAKPKATLKVADARTGENS